jgi:choline dehydrogenase-like flavoprotein
VFDGFTILLNLEQTPSPENRIVLGARRDAFGVPLPELHWRWHEADRERLTRLRDVVARELGALGRIEIATDTIPDPNAHHHAGTTRMHADASHGVVDADCRVHGVDNVFVAGASVFPTAGFANPMLTIVALAARLADHLAVSS